jgi:histidinol phosphatase-like enzyme (inositol monophosphatase family)
LRSYLRELEYALKVVKASERITLKYFPRRDLFGKSRLKVNYKSDKSPVTIADKSCEKFLVKELSKKFPSHGFLGEEFGAGSAKSETRWIIDPIDGTRNFTRGIPYWGTLCGLEDEGQIVAGIMALPALKEVYYASKGQGAYENGKRIRVSKVKELEKSTIVFGGLNFFLGSKYEKGFEEIIKSAYHDRGFGDCFGYTFVAEGLAEAMLDPIVSPWDVAALKIIIEEAHGIFTDFEGDSTIYNRTAVAANPYIHEAVLKKLSQL